MKILIVAGPFVSLREPYNGGTEAFIIEHANQLVKLGHDVDVIAKDADEKNLFQVIAFPESPLSMKDESYRPVTEEKGQQNFQALQYGIFDVSVYDVIHYVKDAILQSLKVLLPFFFRNRATKLSSFAVWHL